MKQSTLDASDTLHYIYCDDGLKPFAPILCLVHSIYLCPFSAYLHT